MKSKFTILLLILIPFFGIKAQKPIIISEDSLKIGNSLLPGLSVIIPEASYDKTLKVWIRDLQAGTKSKVISENGEMSIFGAKIKSISSTPVNVYSKLVRLDSMLQLFASFETKKDLYAERSTGAPEFTKAYDYLKGFAKDQYIEVAKDQADTEEKKLRDLQKELSSLENEKSHMQKSIQSNNNSIISEKENITAQKNELDIVNIASMGQDSTLASMEEGPAKKEKAQQIKDLEKRKKKALNSIESSEKKIQKSNEEIDKATNEIPQNEKMQEKVREQVVAQEAVYQRFADKLKKIKSF
jgi:chromosome condensin MukBEF ATPase and DNA-binding subunit MukB